MCLGRILKDIQGRKQGKQIPLDGEICNWTILSQACARKSIVALSSFSRTIALQCPLSIDPAPIIIHPYSILHVYF